ncbi:hypothetical protein CVIRNUC_008249 [Coccomyxa viridis]|uniref:DJ-1/PfpI domain-containing protein n=1 Tax=Coccomyxa viridis TaxID=1274662 RepID=A0AAV1IG96_9CHLO|nr:hypothetical protein CVIRNUC_008249 [Coccomyxa viridis]
MVVRAERLLFITTSVSNLGDGKPTDTGLWLQSLAEPYYLFQKKGYITEIASLKGGSAPVDRHSTQPPHNRHPMVKRFLNDREALVQLENCTPVAFINPERYSAIFITDGHAIAADAPYSRELQRLVSQAFAEKKVVAAVGYGVSALLNAKILDAKHPQAGMSILYGKQVTGYSNAEAEASGFGADHPFPLEDKIEAAGGEYTRGSRNEGPFANRAGLIITGQNVASALQVAELVVEALSYGVRLTP